MTTADNKWHPIATCPPDTDVLLAEFHPTRSFVVWFGKFSTKDKKYWVGTPKEDSVVMQVVFPTHWMYNPGIEA